MNGPAAGEWGIVACGRLPQLGDCGACRWAATANLARGDLSDRTMFVPSAHGKAVAGKLIDLAARRRDGKSDAKRTRHGMGGRCHGQGIREFAEVTTRRDKW